MASASISTTTYKRVYIGPTACLRATLVSGGTGDTYEMAPFTGAGADSAAVKHRIFGLTSSPMNDSAGSAHVIANGISNGFLELAVAGGVVNDRNLLRFFTW